MRLSVYAFALLPGIVFAAGCAHRAAPPIETVALDAPGLTSAKLPAGKNAKAAHAKVDAKVADFASTDARKPGDYVVHRFSGTFRKHALVLAERVHQVKGPIIIIDYMLGEERGTKVEPGMHLRVTFDRTPGAPREVATVTRIVGDESEPGTLEDYEKLMAETMVVPDRNDEIVGTEVAKAQIGEQSIDCKKTSYRVSLGKKKATLSTCVNDSFAWGDVGGEIRADGGKIIYRAEIVEHGSGNAATKAASR